MKNKGHKIFILLLTGILSLSLMVPAKAAETEEEKIKALTISSMDDFLRFQENCVKDIYSQDLQVNLETDLDFTGMDFKPVPIFAGTFLGNKHTIQGIHLTEEGSNQGFFRYLTETAVVKDLTIHGELLPEGSKQNIGGIAGSNAGQILFCTFKGQASGTESVGGIAGINQVTGIIENCMVSGALKGSHFIGGIVGENLGVIRKCKNLASVNIKEEDNKINTVTLSPEFMKGKEAVDTSTDLGGIAGTNTGLIRQCMNHGNVGYPKMGYNVGGIAGSSKGYIVGSKNHADIRGRKEVAGIAGQLEPVVEISYQKDTMQILREQLNNTSSLANRASSNMKANAGDLQSDIDSLHGSAETALDALDTLLPHGGDWPDHDTIIAAQNTLSGSLGSMQNSLGNINNSAQSIVGTAAADIRAINRSIAEISHTLDTAADHLGGTITDISDMDTDEDLTGKIEACNNGGSIEGDLNVGGITGAISLENDLDPEDDYTVAGDRSLNFDSRLRAVILDCSNTGKITVSKKNGGGIAGKLSLGLIKNCQNTGFVESENADYLGGIAGSSLGFLRSSNAKCKVIGGSYLGGIAGSAAIVSDCRSTAMVEGSGEQLGSVLGIAVHGQAETEMPISLNYYLPFEDHLGAIDGIDYYGLADSLNKEDFLNLPELPTMFFSSSVLFQFPDGSSRRVSVPLEGALSKTDIPEPPQKEGYIGKWDGLQDLELNNMFFNMTLNTLYTPINQVIESEEKTERNTPILLAEGQFGEQEHFHVNAYSDPPQNHPAAKAWTLPDLGENTEIIFHLAIPAEIDPTAARILILTANETWEERTANIDGSYLLFSAGNGDQAVAVYESGERQIKLAVTAIFWIIFFSVILFTFITIRKHKKKKA